MNHSTPGLLVHHQLPESTQAHIHQVSHAIQPSHSLSSPSPPVPHPSLISNESTLKMRCPKYWSFSFRIIPSKVIPGLISFRMDWLDLLAIQETLKSLLQHHKSVLLSSAFFMVQLSHPYMTTGKTIALWPSNIRFYFMCPFSYGLFKSVNLSINLSSTLHISKIPELN